MREDDTNMIINLILQASHISVRFLSTGYYKLNHTANGPFTPHNLCIYQTYISTKKKHLIRNTLEK